MDVKLPDGRVLKNVPEGTTKAQIAEKLGMAGDRSLLEKGVNLAAAYTRGRTFGFGPKIAAGVGTAIAKPVLEGVEVFTGKEAPSIGELYRSGYDMYSKPAEQAYEDNPILATGAELAGGLRTGSQFGKTGTGETVRNWTAGVKPAADASRLAKTGAAFGKAGRNALVGEAAYRAYKVGTAEPGTEGEELVSGLPVGGIAGGALSLAGSGIGALAPKINEAKKPIVDLAKKYNIPLGLDDISDSKFYKTLVSEGESVPFSGSQKYRETQARAFNKAIARSVGLETDRLTAEAMDDAFTKVGQEFDDLTKGKTFSISGEGFQSLKEIQQRADLGNYGSDGLKNYSKYLKDLFGTAKQGQVDGDRLSKVRSALNNIKRGAGNPDAKALAGDLENAIIDLIKAGDDDVGKALSQAKYKYKNLITIEPLAQKAQVEGNISPAQLITRVRQVYGREFTKGKAGDLGDLANIGQYIKEGVPNSGTSQRTLARNLLTGNVAGAPFTFAFGGPLAAALQVGASGVGMGVNRAIQAANYGAGPSNPQALGKLLANYRSPLPIATGQSAALAGLLAQ